MSNNTSGNNQSNEFDTLELVHCVSRDESGSETVLSAMLEFKTNDDETVELIEAVVINIAQYRCWNDDALKGLLIEIERQLSDFTEYRSTDPTKIILDATMQQYCHQTGLHYNSDKELNIGDIYSNDIRFLAIGKSHITMANQMLKKGMIVLSESLKESVPDNLPKKISSFSSAFALLAARIQMSNDHLKPQSYANLNSVMKDVFGYTTYI